MTNWETDEWRTDFSYWWNKKNKEVEHALDQRGDMKEKDVPLNWRCIIK